MRLYLDSSAFLKRYLKEAGTPRVIELCGGAEEVLLSVIVTPECLATLNRLRRERRLSEQQYGTTKQELLDDLGEATLVQLEHSVVEKAISCVERSPLRALDAIHVASALECKPDRFLSADRRQCEAARAAGLNVEEITP
jgi:predicted nucleic acid-binding protein